MEHKCWHYKSCAIRIFVAENVLCVYSSYKRQEKLQNLHDTDLWNMCVHTDRSSIERKKLYIERESTKKTDQNIKSDSLVRFLSNFFFWFAIFVPLSNNVCN